MVINIIKINIKKQNNSSSPSVWANPIFEIFVKQLSTSNRDNYAPHQQPKS